MLGEKKEKKKKIWNRQCVSKSVGPVPLYRPTLLTWDLYILTIPIIHNAQYRPTLLTWDLYILTIPIIHSAQYRPTLLTWDLYILTIPIIHSAQYRPTLLTWDLYILTIPIIHSALYIRFCLVLWFLAGRMIDTDPAWTSTSGQITHFCRHRIYIPTRASHSVHSVQDRGFGPQDRSHISGTYMPTSSACRTDHTFLLAWDLYAD